VLRVAELVRVQTAAVIGVDFSRLTSSADPFLAVPKYEEEWSIEIGTSGRYGEE
jgi:hypothetical protein